MVDLGKEFPAAEPTTSAGGVRLDKAPAGPGPPPGSPGGSSGRQRWLSLLAVVLVAAGGAAVAATVSSSGPGDSGPGGAERPAAQRGATIPQGGIEGGGESALTVTEPTPAVAPAPGPATVARRHLRLIDAGQPDRAFALLSARYRVREPRWPSQQRAARPHINVVSMGAAAVSGDDAWVPVRFYARDSAETKRSDLVCRRFDGRMHLRKTGGRWYYDPARALTTTEMASGGPACP